MVSGVVAGGSSSAFLTSAPDEFPDPKQPQLLDRSACVPSPFPLAIVVLHFHISHNHTVPCCFSF